MIQTRTRLPLTRFALTRKGATAVIAPVALVLTLAACGGSSSGASTAAGTAAPTSSASAGARGGFQNNAQFQKIQECLTAAGISIPTPSRGAFPSGGTRPTAMPTGGMGGNGGTPPSGAPGGGGFGGGGFGGAGGMGSMLQSDSAKAALKACGLTVPTGRPSAQSTAN